jgi:hypothetical protein
VTVPITVDGTTLVDGTCDGTAGNGLFNTASLAGSAVPGSDACQPIVSGRAAIRLQKTVGLGVDFDNDNYGDVGDVLNYQLIISNIGTQELSVLHLNDPTVIDLTCDPLTMAGQPVTVLLNEQIFLSGFDEGALGVLPVGDHVMCWATHTLTAADVARRTVVNSATASAEGQSDEVVSSTSTAIYGGFQ